MFSWFYGDCAGWCFCVFYVFFYLCAVAAVEAVAGKGAGGTLGVHDYAYFPLYLSCASYTDGSLLPVDGS